MSHRNILAILIYCLLLALGGCVAGKKEQKDAQVHYMLGISYLQEPNPTLALREFLLAAELNPYDAAIQMALGQAYQLKNAYAQAERHYLRALDLDEDNPVYQNNLAALYLDTGRWDDAVRLFRSASANLLFAEPEVALTGMGFAYLRKGDSTAAIQAFEQALAHNQSYVLAHLRLGETYLALGRTDEALNALRQAVKLSPNFAEAHYSLAQANLKAQRQRDAAAALREVVRLAPGTERGRLAAEQLRQLR